KLSVDDFKTHALALSSPDELSVYIVRQLMRQQAPSLLWITMHDIDIAHAGAYSLYIDGIRRTDRLCADIWKAIQSDPEYGGQKTGHRVRCLAATPAVELLAEPVAGSYRIRFQVSRRAPRPGKRTRQPEFAFFRTNQGLAARLRANPPFLPARKFRLGQCPRPVCGTTLLSSLDHPSTGCFSNRGARLRRSFARSCAATAAARAAPRNHRHRPRSRRI